MVITDKLNTEPTLAKPIRDTEELTREKLLMDSVDPRDAKPRTARAAPIRL